MSEYVMFNSLAALALLVYGWHILSINGLTVKARLMLSVSMGLAFLIGSRLLYAVLYLDKIIGEPEKLFELKLVNFSLYGGLLLSLLVFVLAMRKVKIDAFTVTDDLMPVLGISLMLSKLGCFYNGCCYGIPTNLPWGVVFEHADSNAVTSLLDASPLIKLISGVQQVPRHPTQLYEAGFAILAGLISLIFLVSKRRKVKRADLEIRNGLATLSFIWVYTMGRWVSFYFRDFPYATELSIFIRGPLIYGMIIAITSVMLVLKSRRFSKGA
ncbi:prolipoprotein diacylglyceryl transferase family protein [Fusibacter bizertensis]